MIATPDKITTDRLYLTPLVTEDHEFIYRLVNTEGWLKFIGDRNIHSAEAAVDYIIKINSSADIHYWVARLTDDHTPIGIITLIKRDYLPQPDIGFAFLPEYGGRGFAYEACKEVLVGMNGLYPVILAVTKPDNKNSINLLTRLGFSFDKATEAGKEIVHTWKIKY